LNYAPTLTTVRVSIILFNVMSFVAVLSTISLLTAVLSLAWVSVSVSIVLVAFLLLLILKVAVVVG
jgi:hypothetical protein